MDKLTSCLFSEKRASLLAVLLLPLLLVLTQCGGSDDKDTIKSAKLVVSVSIDSEKKVVTASVSNTGNLESIEVTDGLVYITGATAAAIALKADGSVVDDGTEIGSAKDLPAIVAGADATIDSDANDTAIAIDQYYGVCITESVCVAKKLLAVAVLELDISINAANTVVTASVTNTGSVDSIAVVSGLVYITGDTAAVIALKAIGTPVTGGTAIGEAKDLPAVVAGADAITIDSDANSTAIVIGKYYGVCIITLPRVCASAQVAAPSSTLSLTDLVVGVSGSTEVQSEATDLTLSVKVASDLALASGDATLRFYRSATDYNDATVTPSGGIKLGGDVTVAAIVAGASSAVLTPTKKTTSPVADGIVNAITASKVTVPILDLTTPIVNSYFYGVCVYAKTGSTINSAPELCKALEVNIQGVNLVLAVTLNTAKTTVTASITNSGNIASTALTGGLVYITGATEAVIDLKTDGTPVTGGTAIGAAKDLTAVALAAATTVDSDAGTALVAGVYYGVCVKGTVSKQITGFIDCASVVVP